MPTTLQPQAAVWTDTHLDALLTALGPAWRRGDSLDVWWPSNDVVQLIYDDPTAPGAGLYLTRNDRTHRLAVSGVTSGPEHCNMVSVLPYGSPHREALTASVTLALTKTPERMAREISTRFLSAYLPAWEAAYACFQEHQAQQQDLNAYMTDLAAILQTDRFRPTTRDTEARIDAYTPGGVSATFRASHTNYVRVEALTLNRHQARDLAALIASWNMKGIAHA